MDDRPLTNRRILVVEDEFLLAFELCDYLEGFGALVSGPVGTINDALALVETTPDIDVAVLDASLQGEMVFPVADKLEEQGIPFLFTTGYDASVIPTRFKHIELFGKPTNFSKLCEAINKLVLDQDRDQL